MILILKICDIRGDKEIAIKQSVVWFDFDDEILITWTGNTLYLWNFSNEIQRV
jgi:hypothetical protein